MNYSFRALTATITLLLLGFMSSKSEVSDYCLSQSIGTYMPIVTGDTVNWTIGDNNEGRAMIELEFPFSYNGNSYSQLWLSTNGWLQFGAIDPGTSSLYDAPSYLESASINIKNGLAFFCGNLQGSDDGIIRYRQSGVQPNRKIVIQLDSWHAYQGIANMQIQLNENGNIAIVFGSFSSNGANANISIGLKGDNRSDFNGVTGAFSDLQKMSLFNNKVQFSNISVPVQGLTLLWSEVTTSTLNYTAVLPISEPIQLTQKKGEQTLARVQMNFCGPDQVSLRLNSISFVATGTTNINCISYAKLYYTGGSSTFSSLVQIGGTITNLNEIFTFTPTTPMVFDSKNNNFWLVYNINNNVSDYDILFANCMNISLINSDNIISNYNPNSAPVRRKFIYPMKDFCSTISNSTYTTFIDGNLISNWANTNEDRKLIDIGFPLPYNGQTYTQAWISTNGWVQFGPTDPGNNYASGYLSNSNSKNGVAIMNMDLNGYASGSVRYKTIGTSYPDRAFVVQYNNWHVNGQEMLSYLNVQLWIYETGNIQIKFGNCSNPASSKTNVASIGIKGDDNNQYAGYYNKFSAIMPMASLGQTMSFTDANSVPANGLTFGWDRGIPFSYRASGVNSISGTINLNTLASQQPVAKIIVDLCGIQAPPQIELGSMSFTAEGTTNLQGVENAKLYYTEYKEEFSINNQIGGTITSVNGVFTFTPTNPLIFNTSKNVFWIAYGLNQSFTESDKIQVNCTNIQLVTDGITLTNYLPSPATASRTFSRSMSGNYTVGNIAGADFQNLTAAWNALMTKTVSGNITFRLISDLSETLTFNQFTTVPQNSSYTVTILPYGRDCMITSANLSSAAVFTINGVDNLNIGDPNGLYRLSIYNIKIQSGTTTCVTLNNFENDPCKNITIANCILLTGNNTNTNSYGILVSGTGGYNLNFISNRIYKVNYGIYFSGGVSYVTNKITISRNFFGDNSIPNGLNSYGIYMNYVENLIIADNEISNSCSGAFTCMHLTNCPYLKVLNNNLHDIISSGIVNGFNIQYCSKLNFNGNIIKNIINNTTTNIYEINILSNQLDGLNCNITNNHFGKISTKGSSLNIPSLIGIYLSGTSENQYYIKNYKIINNTFAFYGSNTLNASGISADIYVNSNFYMDIDITNNLFYNNMTNVRNYCVWINGVNPIGNVSNNNDFWLTGADGNIGNYNGTDIVGLFGWREFTGGDEQSLNVDPRIVSEDIPILSATSILAGAGNGNTNLTTDVNGLMRSNPPSIGAYEGQMQGLISPANHAYEVRSGNAPLGPTVFEWTPFAGANNYRLQVSKSADFFKMVIDAVVTNATSYSTEILEPSCRYYWRVQALNGNGIVNYYSQTWDFCSNGVLLFAPVLRIPYNNTDNLDLPVSFAWSKIMSAQHYIIQLSTSSDFSTIYYQKSVFDTVATLFDEIAPLSIYYWRVKAVKMEFESPWSSTFRFVTSGLMTSISQPFSNPPLLDLGWTGTTNPFSLTVVESDGDYSTSPYTLPGMGRLNTRTARGQGYIISPKINLISTSTSLSKISLWLYRDQVSTTAEKITVGLNANPTDNGMTTLLTTVNNVDYSSIFRCYTNAPATTLGWHNYKFNIPAGTNGNYYIIIRAMSNTENNIFIDDISYSIPVINYTVSSVTTSQKPSVRLPKGTKNRFNVLGVKIVAEGNHFPVKAEQFTFNTNGTTNPASIKNARLFTSGSKPYFIDNMSEMQIGETIANPDGVFSFNVPGLKIENGANYFWLTFEIPDEAVIGSVIDAECVNVKVSGVDYAPFTSGQMDYYTVRGIEQFDIYSGFYVTINNDVTTKQIGVINNGVNCYTGLYDRPGYFSKYDETGNPLGIENCQELASVTNHITEMAFDGDFYYGVSNGSNIFKISLSPATLEGLIPLPEGVLAYSIAFDSSADNGRGGFWVAGKESDIVLVSRLGAELLRIPAINHGLTGVAGMALDHYSQGGPFLWLFDLNSSGRRTTLIQIGNIYLDDLTFRGIPTGVTREVAPEAIPDYQSAVEAGGLEIRLDSSTKDYFLYGIVQNNEYKNRIFEYYLGNLNPMISVNNKVETASEDYIQPGSFNQPIVRVDVFTKGQAQPIIINGLKLRTTGTTQLSDISSLSVYYTGSSENFNLDNQFGLSVDNPGQDLIVNGLGVLSEGHNYFWIVYNISPNAIQFDYIDAKCDTIFAERNSLSEYYIPEQIDNGYRQIVLPLNGTYTVGNGGQFLNFKKAFMAANLVGLAGNVEMQIVSDILEPAVASLDQWEEINGSGYSMIIYPVDQTRTVSSRYGTVFAFNGSDRVTIDGSLNGNGSTRNLNITSDYFTMNDELVFAPVSFLRVSSSGSTHCGIQNCVIKGGCNNGSHLSNGILIYATDDGYNEGFHDINIKNNLIIRAANGIYIQSADIGRSSYGIHIENNEIGSVSSNNYITRNGIFINYAGVDPVDGTNPVEIKNNQVYNIINYNRNSEISGISVFNSKQTQVAGNKVFNIKNFRLNSGVTYPSRGLLLVNNENSEIFNNAVSNIVNQGIENAPDAISGIALINPLSNNICFNSINLYGSISSTNTGFGSTCLCLTGGEGNTVKNNILANRMPLLYPSCFYISNSNVFDEASTDYNLYYAPYIANISEQYLNNLNAVRGLLDKDKSSIAGDPLFISDNNLDVNPNSPAVFNGTRITGIDYDINGLTRNSQPSMGAYEYGGTDLLAKPRLILPRNKSFAIEYNACLFSWQPVDNATYYQLEWSTDSLFNTSSIEEVEITERSVNLEAVTKYFFRVKAYNDLGQSNWSDVFSFYTNGTLLSPSLVYPQANEMNLPLKFTSFWSFVRGASHYYVQLADNPNFINSNEYICYDTTLCLQNLSLASNYFWKVKASNGSYTSGWSTVSHFSTTSTISCESVPMTYASSSSYPTVYAHAHRSSHFQMLIAGTELCNFETKTMRNIAFYVLNSGNVGTIPNFSIKIKHTRMNEITNWDFLGDWTQVLDNSNINLINGWNNHVFNTPFNWDGVRNILIDVCMGSTNEQSSSNASTGFSKTTKMNCFIQSWSDDIDQCSSPIYSYISPDHLRPVFKIGFGSSEPVDLPIPLLVSPANDAMELPLSPIFEWSLIAPNNPADYNYKIELTDLETELSDSIVVENSNTFRPYFPLYEDRNYSWRAKAVTMAGEEGSWSATFTFRTIKYCSAGALLCSPQLTQHITNVQFGDINNPSACSAQGGYTNFNLYNDMVVGTSMPIIITAENASSSDMVGVWIDLNQNGIFTDAGEYFATTTTDNVTYSANVVIPIDAPFGQSRVRVRISNEPLTSCGNTEIGEVEDYRLVITPALPVITLGSISVTTYCAGDVLQVPFTVLNNNLLAGNKFSAYLGTENPVFLGTVSGTATGEYVINASIPVDILTNGYQLYVVSTAPQANSDMLLLTVNAKPIKYTVNGGSSICEGSRGTEISLENSQIGINYELYRGNELVATVEGTDAPLVLGYFNIAGEYTVKGVNPLTSCWTNMAGSATITIIPSPQIFEYSGESSYCSTATTPGVTIGLDDTEVDFAYTLMQAESVLESITGTGAAMTFTGTYTAGTYYVVAKNTQECASNYPNLIITVSEPPVQFELLGGGDVCPESGLPITLSGSEANYTYKLYNSTTLVGTFTGTGSSIELGAYGAGSYTMRAINGACTTDMLNTIAINQLPLPTKYVFNASNNGHYCNGSTSGVNLILEGSQVGKNYEFYLNGTLVATLTGTGAPLAIEQVTEVGAYTVKAIDATTLCNTMMNETVTVVADAVEAVTGGTPNNESINPDNALFGWNQSVCASSYRFVISLNQDLSLPQIDMTLSKSDLVLPIPVNGLNYRSTYYWAVYAINGEVVVPSETWTFTTIDPTPTQEIALPHGWSIISTNLYPQNTSLEAIFTGIVDKLLIIKEGSGNFWMPPSTGSLENWDALNGYQLYMFEPRTLTVRGNHVPVSTPIPLANAGWYMVSYLPTAPMQAQLALSSIANKLVIAKNGNGEMYWPMFGVNNLENSAGTMVEGKGYLIYVVGSSTLVYPTPMARKSDVNSFEIELQNEILMSSTTRTGNNASLVLVAENLATGTEIGVYNSSNAIVGTGVVRDGRAAITIWGDNPATTEVEGSSDGELLTMKALNKTSQQLTDIKLESVNELTNSTITKTLNYKRNGLFVARLSTGETTKVVRIANNPNPFSESTTIEFELSESGNATVEVYTLEGVKIATLANGTYDTSIQQVEFKSTDVASGTYKLVLRSGSHVATTMMVVVK